MDIPLKFKHRAPKPRSGYKGGHNDGNRKRPGYLKGKFRTGGHVSYTMVMDVRGRRHMVPSDQVV